MSYQSCDELIERYKKSRVELREWTNWIETPYPLSTSSPQPTDDNPSLQFTYHMPQTINNNILWSGQGFMVKGIRLRGTLNSPIQMPALSGFRFLSPQIRLVIAVDHHPQTLGDIYVPSAFIDCINVKNAYGDKHPIRSYVHAPRRLDTANRFTILHDQLFIMNPQNTSWDSTGEAEGNFTGQAWNNQQTSDIRNSRFDTTVEGQVIGHLPGLSTAGSVQGSGPGANALEAFTNDPTRLVQFDSMIEGGPFAIAGDTTLSDLAINQNNGKYMAPVSKPINIDIPFHKDGIPMRFGATNAEGRPLVTANDIVFWFQTPYLYQSLQYVQEFFRFEGFSELFYTDL